MPAERTYPPAPKLVETFFQAAEAAFEFLTEDHGVIPQRRVRGFGSGQFDRTDLTSLPDNAFFLAEVRWEAPDWTVRITYGEREFEFNTLIAPRTEADQEEYALWEWLDALGMSYEAALDYMWAMKPDRMQSIVSAMGAALHTRGTEILHPSRDVVDRARKLRDKRRAAQWAEQRNRDHRRASARAADAFREGKYNAVVQHLEPFADVLSPAEEKKLKYSREKLDGGGRG